MTENKSESHRREQIPVAAAHWSPSAVAIGQPIAGVTRHDCRRRAYKPTTRPSRSTTKRPPLLARFCMLKLVFDSSRGSLHIPFETQAVKRLKSIPWLPHPSSRFDVSVDA